MRNESFAHAQHQPPSHAQHQPPSHAQHQPPAYGPRRASLQRRALRLAARRASALLLAFAVAAGCAPPSFWQALGVALPGAESLGGILEAHAAPDPNIDLDKTASWVADPLDDGVAEVTLSITGKEVAKDVDVVLLLDYSPAMDSSACVNHGHYWTFTMAPKTIANLEVSTNNGMSYGGYGQLALALAVKAHKPDVGDAKIVELYLDGMPDTIGGLAITNYRIGIYNFVPSDFQNGINADNGNGYNDAYRFLLSPSGFTGEQYSEPGFSFTFPDFAAQTEIRKIAIDAGCYTYRTSAVAATKAFVDALLSPSRDNTVTLFAFASNSYPVGQAMADKSSKSALLAAIDGLPAQYSGINDYEKPLSDALGVYGDSSRDKARPFYIIFVSCAQPTEYENLSQRVYYDGTRIDTTDIVVHGVALGTKDYNTADRNAMEAIKAISVDKAYDGHSSDPSYKGDFTVAEDGDDLSLLFSNIAEKLVAPGKDFTIRDPISPYFEFDASRPPVYSHGTFDDSELPANLLWTMDYLPVAGPATFTYYLKMKAQYMFDPDDPDTIGDFPTNGVPGDLEEATVVYINSDGAYNDLDFPGPRLSQNGGSFNLWLFAAQSGTPIVGGLFPYIPVDKATLAPIAGGDEQAVEAGGGFFYNIRAENPPGSGRYALKYGTAYPLAAPLYIQNGSDWFKRIAGQGDGAAEGAYSFTPRHADSGRTVYVGYVRVTDPNDRPLQFRVEYVDDDTGLAIPGKTPIVMPQYTPDANGNVFIYDGDVYYLAGDTVHLYRDNPPPNSGQNKYLTYSDVNAATPGYNGPLGSDISVKLVGDPNNMDVLSLRYGLIRDWMEVTIYYMKDGVPDPDATVTVEVEGYSDGVNFYPHKLAEFLAEYFADDRFPEFYFDHTDHDFAAAPYIPSSGEITGFYLSRQWPATKTINIYKDLFDADGSFIYDTALLGTEFRVIVNGANGYRQNVYLKANQFDAAGARLPTPLEVPAGTVGADGKENAVYTVTEATEDAAFKGKYDLLEVIASYNEYRPDGGGIVVNTTGVIDLTGANDGANASVANVRSGGYVPPPPPLPDGKITVSKHIYRDGLLDLSPRPEAFSVRASGTVAMSGGVTGGAVEMSELLYNEGSVVFEPFAGQGMSQVATITVWEDLAALVPPYRFIGIYDASLPYAEQSRGDSLTLSLRANEPGKSVIILNADDASPPPPPPPVKWAALTVHKLLLDLNGERVTGDAKAFYAHVKGQSNGFVAYVGVRAGEQRTVMVPAGDKYDIVEDQTSLTAAYEHGGVVTSDADGEGNRTDGVIDFTDAGIRTGNATLVNTKKGFAPPPPPPPITQGKVEISKYVFRNGVEMPPDDDVKFTVNLGATAQAQVAQGRSVTVDAPVLDAQFRITEAVQLGYELLGIYEAGAIDLFHGNTYMDVAVMGADPAGKAVVVFNVELGRGVVDDYAKLNLYKMALGEDGRELMDSGERSQWFYATVQGPNYHERHQISSMFPKEGIMLPPGVYYVSEQPPIANGRYYLLEIVASGDRVGGLIDLSAARAPVGGGTITGNVTILNMRDPLGPGNPPPVTVDAGKAQATKYAFEDGKALSPDDASLFQIELHGPGLVPNPIVKYVAHAQSAIYEPLSPGAVYTVREPDPADNAYVRIGIYDALDRLNRANNDLPIALGPNNEGKGVVVLDWKRSASSPNIIRAMKNVFVDGSLEPPDPSKTFTIGIYEVLPSGARAFVASMEVEQGGIGTYYSGAGTFVVTEEDPGGVGFQDFTITQLGAAAMAGGHEGNATLADDLPGVLFSVDNEYAAPTPTQAPTPTPTSGANPTPPPYNPPSGPTTAPTPSPTPGAGTGTGTGAGPTPNPTPTPTPALVPDEDIPRGFVQDHIQYINGYPDGSVQPDADITRAETSAILFRLMSDPNKGRALESKFPDVTDDLWYAQSVKYLTDRGIIHGYPDGTFLGDNPITRAEFATLISGFDELVPSSTNAFPDIEDHWAVGYINSAAAKGWVAGYPDGSFRPEDYLTRAEIVTVINRMLKRGIELADIPAWAPSYNDIDDSHWGYTNIIEASVGHEFERKDNDSETWPRRLAWSAVLES